MPTATYTVNAKLPFQLPRVNGHLFVPVGGQEFSPLVDMVCPRGRT